jgi:phage-related minor tail protein
MADRIKGITIEIDGDTKGLSQALKGVNKDIKTTQTQLRDINKLLKLDPTNATLLKQKMDALGKEISQTKDKLSQLKSVQEEMEQGLKNGTVTQDQYDAWQREIIETENALKDLEKELKNVPSASDAMLTQVGGQMDALGQKVSSVGDKISTIGDKLMVVTGAITAAGAASIKSWQEVDGALDTIISKTGATGDKLAEMQDIVENIATSVPSDFQTISNSVAEVSTRFDMSGDDLERLSTEFIKFAKLNNTDVVGSIDNVSAMMNAWGLDASQTESVLNTLNAVGQKTGVNASELASILQSNALSFKEMGYDIADASVLLGQMSKQGVDASVGVTALRKAMAKSIDEGTSLNEVIAEWEALMSSSASETEKLARTEEIFGSKAFAQLYNAIKEGNISFTDINASMSDFSGNLDKTFEATLDPIDEFTTTMNELKLLGAEIGEEVIPVLVDVLKDLKPILDDIKEVWEGMSPEEQRQLIENLGKIALIAPSLSIGGKAIGGVGSAISGLGKAAKTLGSLGLGAKLGSLFGSGGALSGLASAGATIGSSLLAGLGGALAGGAVGELIDHHIIAPILEKLGSDSADWYKNFHWFGEGGFFDYVFGGGDIHQAIQDYYGAFQEMGADISQSFDNMKTNALDRWNALKDGIKSVVENISNWLSDTWLNITTKVTETWTLVKDTIIGAWETVKQTFTEWKDGVFNTFQEIYDKIKGIWDSLGEMFANGFDLKLPHISVTGGIAPYGIGGQGSLPKFNVDWYANGGILTNPTIFGMQGGRFLGGGEAGAEAVLPLSELGTMITEGMTAAMGGAGDTVINVSIDNNSLGSVILTAQQMMNLRRGK